MTASLWLLPTVSLSVTGDDAILYDSFTEVRIPKRATEVRRMLELLDGEHGRALLSDDLGCQLAALLDERGWLVRLQTSLRTLAAEHPERTRQLSYFAHICPDHPDRAFEEVAEARVLIVGTGGIGSYLAYHLAASGVRRFTLNDPDRIEVSNLNRQVFFTRQDIGRLKVDALADALRARFDDLELETAPFLADAPGLAALIEPVDLVAICGEAIVHFDDPPIVGDTSIISAGYHGASVYVGPAVSPRHGTPAWRELVPPGLRAARAARDAAAVPRLNHWNCSGAQINGVGGALLGEAAIRLLAPSLGGPILLQKRRYLDMRTLKVREHSFDLPPCSAEAPGRPGSDLVRESAGAR